MNLLLIQSKTTCIILTNAFAVHVNLMSSSWRILIDYLEYSSLPLTFWSLAMWLLHCLFMVRHDIEVFQTCHFILSQGQKEITISIRTIWIHQPHGTGHHNWESNCFGWKIWLLFPGGSDGKESACNAGDLGSILGLGRLPGEGNGNPLKYSCLENPMDRGAWQSTVHGVTKNWTWLSD